MSDWKVGQKVFAFWDEDEYWYPATITQVDGDEVSIRFGDGREAITDEDGLVELALEAEDEVEAWWEPDQKYLPAIVLGVNGDRVEVEYDDETVKSLSVDQIRYESGDEWTVGDRVFAFYEDDGYLYPATVTKIEEDDITIHYDDGEEELTVDDYLIELYVETGEEVEAKRSLDDQYFPAQIIDIQEERIQVEFEDGTTEWTKISNIRLEGEVEEEG